MRISGATAAILLLLAACGSRDDGAPANDSAEAQPATGAAAAEDGAVPANIIVADGSGATRADGGAKPQDPRSGEGSAAPQTAADTRAVDPAEPPGGAAGPCMMQGRERLRVTAMRAVGTEPFWGARIEGRCVTYTHPDDQGGTRIWTRFKPDGSRGTWSGTLGGRRFELRLRAAPGCSDGMSDKSYPLAAELTVNNEKRSGCAEPS